MGFEAWTEAEATRERLPTERAVDDLLNHFERQKLPIGRNEFNALISDVRTEDLSAYKLESGRVPIAHLRGRELICDERFNLLNPEQQMHIIAHDYSHGLTKFFLNSSSREKFLQVSQLTSMLPKEQVSYYVNYLEQNQPESKSKATFIHNEALAEVMAQYMESDRSFGGFIRAKLLEFPQGDREASESERAEFQKVANIIGSLEEYLDIADNEQEREAFLTRHGLGEHYELWREMDELFREANFSEMESTIQETPDWDDYDFWEEEMLAQHFHTEASLKPGQSPRTAFPTKDAEPDKPTGLGDLITFWRIFF
ncbi:MAG: hypothetical protein HZB70_02990 [Candidatus Berkelbacteria bacterium]|nr:MAG: hypothetical protein HZB70_02990 [Candidatus Berkelbacteria bacterium]QQG51729.1 MAG: hypothetical protein HY845_00005 [Candidatus Berkelbacteria bacterium]